ncbi:PcfB family protein [Dehalobacter sp. TBBPA1]|uniref:PcfB family protein n=1 Tax=Dehalobacter sp. TBBPA1 TaxID=3235037 RepID=UPI0034A13298
MNSGADAADQMVNMSLKGIEVMAKISGEGARNLATYLYAVLKDQKKTKGKTRLEGLLRSGKELKVFAVKNEDLKRFCLEAKRYGVLYCALQDKKNLDGMCDIMVRAEDASKINRIVERFKLATVDTASIKSEIEKAKAARDSQKEPTTKVTPAEKSPEDFINERMAKPAQIKKTVEPVDNPNPTTATTEKSRPSEPFSARSGKSAEGAERQKKSVREELREIKNAQKEQAERLKRGPVREQPQAAIQNAGPQRRQVKFPKSKPKER